MTYTSGQRSIMAKIISYYGHEPQKMMLLEQIQMMYHISETKLHKITNEKLHRQLRRIEDEKVELSDASVR